MNQCPRCESFNIRDRNVTKPDLPADKYYVCNTCGQGWEVALNTETNGPDNPVLRNMLMEWIKLERTNYADVGKYAPGSPGRVMLIEAMKTEGFGQTWSNFIYNYLFRAEKQYGLDTQQGRQAMGKAIVSLLHCLETACWVYGDMPRPGMPSGEVEPWMTDLTWHGPDGTVAGNDPDPGASDE